MKLSTFFALPLATIFMTVVTANPTHHAEGELAAHFKADEDFKAAVQGNSIDTLKGLAGVCPAGVAAVASLTADKTAAVSEAAAADNVVNSAAKAPDEDKVAGEPSTALQATADDRPKDLREVMLYIWCQQCREKFNECMNSWKCWISPEACSRTCQCDVLRWKGECKECGYRC